VLVELDPTPGPSGLTKASYGLVDHLRSIDKRRIRRIFGQVSASELADIDQGLRLFLGLSAAFGASVDSPPSA
jgi:mRNA-degrading endonuclease toxin of MazEF toxin-antitoxin module